MSVVLLRARCSNCTPGDALDTYGSSPYGSDGRDQPPWSSRPSPDHAKGHRMSDLVGFIGLGTMGMPMTANLARAGVALVVHDASPSATEAAGKLAGVAVAASASEVAARASVIFTCLPNDDVVRAVYLGAGGIAAGGTAGLITCDCSTVSPEATLEVHRALLPKRITAARPWAIESSSSTMASSLSPPPRWRRRWPSACNRVSTLTRSTTWCARVGAWRTARTSSGGPSGSSMASSRPPSCAS
ncbi:MAG: hypothetical protein DME16_17360 [Candidatus Rokuibacteriota bacterium]|nr:MAG: hypothetical protein DME16_17360 [Candidatus Rokubacteria bacterium]